MSAGIDLQPENEEVLQNQSSDEPAVKVIVETPVRVQHLPRKAGATKTWNLTTTPVRVLAADHRRASATLLAIGGNVLVALTTAAKESAQSSALWPQNIPLIIGADSEIYAATVTGTATLTVITELWATGD
jgi:hypothetical protein